MHTFRRGSLLLALLALLPLLMAGPADAAGRSAWTQMQRQIDEQLRTTTGGVQTSPNEVSYRGGEVVLAFVLPGDTTVAQTAARIARGEAPGRKGASDVVSVNAYFHNCPYAYVGGPDWYCFFEHINYSGRMLKWSNEHCHDGVVNFWNWHFQNMTSSMVNNNKAVSVRAEAYEFTDVGPDATLVGSAARSSMPSGMNDNAEHADVCKR